MDVLEFIDLAANFVVIGVFFLVVLVLPAAAAIKWVGKRIGRSRR